MANASAAHPAAIEFTHGHPLALALVAEVLGSYLNVAGLPLARLLQTLAELDGHLG